MNSSENRNVVLQALRSVADEIKAHKALVLTESDLKCRVYMNLATRHPFSELRQTWDPGVTGTCIHTETKFFDAGGHLKQAPDLVLVNAAEISIISRLDGAPLPSKQFHFQGNPILIELKFLRKRPTPSDIHKIEQDILKAEALRRRNLTFHVFVAVFDRGSTGRDSVQNLFRAHQHQEHTTLVYFSTE